MSDKSERLFEALGELSDAHIDEAAGAEPAQQKGKPHRRRWAAAAACLALVAVGVGSLSGVIPLLPGSPGNGTGGAGHDGASTFMSYAGPVFPLTLREENDSITARRDITLDFSPWVREWVSNEEEVAAMEGLTDAERQEALEQHDEWFPEGGYYRSSDHILVTDAYTLTNPGDADQTVTVLYPFAASLGSLDEGLPALTLDGAALEAGLHVGSYAGGFRGVDGPDDPRFLNLRQAGSWEDYRDVLSDGSYLQNALEAGPDVSAIPVTVYEFTDPYGPARDGDAGIPNPSIRASFVLDYDETTVLTYGFHGARYDREGGTMIQEFSIPMSWGREDGLFYLLVLGEDIEDLTTGGYVTGGTDADTPTLEGCGVTVERYESDLDTMLREILTPEWEERSQGSYRQDDLRLGIDFETFYRAFLEHLLSYGVLSPQPVERYDGAWLENMVQDVTVVDRVCWLEAEVTIPAGGSVTLTASMAKAASFDFACAHTANQGVKGYDLVTRLGSNLSCTAQTATLEDREQIQIVRQNFGFDLENGVNTVALDPEVEHYYLEVRRAETE